MARTLYLTGFGAFPGVDKNPTEGLVESLHGTRFGAMTVHAEVLRVSFDEAPCAIERRIRALQPQILIHLGVAVQATEIRLEHQAINCAHTDRPDADGKLSSEAAIDPTLPLDHSRRSTAEIDALCHTLNAAGFAACASDSAGRYVCNATYFHALGLRPDALFVHLPLPGAEGHDWTEARLKAAVEHLLHAVGNAPRGLL